jgi:hypothetical protein
MDLALGGTPAALAGKPGSSNVHVKIAALVKAFMEPFSFFTIVLFSSELLFILDLPESLYSNVRKSRFSGWINLSNAEKIPQWPCQ